jgi:hypothetical protein
MADLDEKYLSGVNNLMKAMAPTDSDYLTLLTLQGRLAQAIREAHLFGPTHSTKRRDW